jgi:hypothetical protein
MPVPHKQPQKPNRKTQQQQQNPCRKREKKTEKFDYTSNYNVCKKNVKIQPQIRMYM